MQSFRLLTEYYSFLFNEYEKQWCSQGSNVSVSLRSIIHSYSMSTKNNGVVKDLMFPSPYGVLFILIKNRGDYMGVLLNGFRLLTEYYSFLLKK